MRHLEAEVASLSRLLDRTQRRLGIVDFTDSDSDADEEDDEDPFTDFDDEVSLHFNLFQLFVIKGYCMPIHSLTLFKCAFRISYIIE